MKWKRRGNKGYDMYSNETGIISSYLRAVDVITIHRISSPFGSVRRTHYITVLCKIHSPTRDFN